jgi:hypothetical protein
MTLARAMTSGKAWRGRGGRGAAGQGVGPLGKAWGR